MTNKYNKHRCQYTLIRKITNLDRQKKEGKLTAEEKLNGQINTLVYYSYWLNKLKIEVMAGKKPPIDSDLLKSSYDMIISCLMYCIREEMKDSREQNNDQLITILKNIRKLWLEHSKIAFKATTNNTITERIINELDNTILIRENYEHNKTISKYIALMESQRSPSTISSENSQKCSQ